MLSIGGNRSLDFRQLINTTVTIYILTTYILTYTTVLLRILRNFESHSQQAACQLPRGILFTIIPSLSVPSPLPLSRYRIVASCVVSSIVTTTSFSDQPSPLKTTSRSLLRFSSFPLFNTKQNLYQRQFRAHIHICTHIRIYSIVSHAVWQNDGKKNQSC